MGFQQKLEASWGRSGSMLCVGLDPDIDKLPIHIARTHAGIELFCTAIIDATAPVVCAFKPQIA
jgi:orotidine-5'-phosphate decarboxylase